LFPFIFVPTTNHSVHILAYKINASKNQITPGNLCPITFLPKLKKNQYEINPHWCRAVCIYSRYRTKAAHGTYHAFIEVYQLIVWKKSDGTKGSIRVPGIPKAWINMNDTKVLENDIDWGEILAFDLQPGERIDISGTIMEQDDGTLQNYSDFGPQLFRETSFFSTLQNGHTPTFQIIPNILARIAGSASLRNADDWIGTYICSYKLTPQRVLEKNYTVIFNTTYNSNQQAPSPKSGSLATTYRFGGDGSSYIARLNLVISANRVGK
jgi:hypothetical protein